MAFSVNSQLAARTVGSDRYLLHKRGRKIPARESRHSKPRHAPSHFPALDTLICRAAQEWMEGDAKDLTHAICSDFHSVNTLGDAVL